MMAGAAFRSGSCGRHEGLSPAAAAPACADLERLARQVARLSPSHRDPERFHMDRSEIVAELRRLAATLEQLTRKPRG